MMPRSVALVHYHLRRGGVTRVMCSVARILQAAGVRVVLVTGEAPNHRETDGLDVVVVPGLGYDSDARSQEAPALRRQTEAAVFGQLGRLPELWHVHNHSLGKNAAFSAMVNEWALHGVHLVLQPHDFAEDGRPGNLRLLHAHCTDHLATLYPIGGRVRYAVLQERDRRILRSAGARPGDVHVLPNPVTGFQETLSPGNVPARRFLYLTRAIRRKNIGELLFWAIRHRGEMEFAVSLEPEDVAAQISLQGWRIFAKKHELPVQFGVGMDFSRSLEDLVAEYDACITTSVGEGFGMSFLEPYLMNRAVVGRDLPEITAGFNADGVDLSQLYHELLIPESWLPDEFWSCAHHAVDRSREALGQPMLSEKALHNAWVQDGLIDFARLDEKAQRHVLLQMIEHPEHASRLPRLCCTDAGVVENRETIRRCYGEVETLRRLRCLYRLDGWGSAGYLDENVICAAFLDPAGWSLLRM